MAIPEERVPKVEWQGSFAGLPVYTDESLPKGTIQFRDQNHNIIGTITGVCQVRIGADRS
jgi:hypothetical protein